MSNKPLTSRRQRTAVVSDRALEGTVLTDGMPVAPDSCESIWVVEQQERIDSLDTQDKAREHGCTVLVCSFLRSSISEIGPCDSYVGSLRSISAASGLTVHCDNDLLRACREVRGRLTAQSVSVIHGEEIITVTSNGVVRSTIGGRTLIAILQNICDSEVRATSAA